MDRPRQIRAQGDLGPEFFIYVETKFYSNVLEDAIQIRTRLQHAMLGDRVHY